METQPAPAETQPSPAAETQPSPAAETQPSPAAPAESVAQENARATAEDYLVTASFSRSGLIEQLKYEGFTSAQAQYGVDKTGL